MNGIRLRNEIWDYVRSISGHMDRLFKPFMDETGLTMIQLRILLDISENQGQTVGSIGKSIGLASGNASSMCKRLEKDGYIARFRDKLDERVVKLYLTGKGTQLVKAIEKGVSDSYDNFLEAQPEETMVEITNGMEKLITLLKDMEALNSTP